jgi:hypothetical protein
MEDIQVFYLLRINPGSACPATLTRLDITALLSATLPVDWGMGAIGFWLISPPEANSPVGGASL